MGAVKDDSTRPAEPGRVLLVDDDSGRRELHELALEFVGHDVCAVGGNEASEHYHLFAPDLVVCSIDGPGPTRDFHFRLRHAGHPTQQLVMVDPPAMRGVHAEARSELVVVVAAPTPLRALVDRVAVILEPARSERSSSVSVGNLVLDPAVGRTWFAGAEVALTPTEFRLLRVLMDNVDRVVSKRDILEDVWRYDFGGRTNAVETYVGYLRRKLRPLGAPEIVTVRGVGYSLRGRS